MQYTVDDIRREFDSGTFARGHAYAREGRVRKLAWTKNGCEGEVAGSGPRQADWIAFARPSAATAQRRLAHRAARGLSL